MHQAVEELVVQKVQEAAGIRVGADDPLCKELGSDFARFRFPPLLTQHRPRAGHGPLCGKAALEPFRTCPGG